MRHRFIGFELDCNNFELRVDGRAVGIQPRVFDLLHYLVLHRDRVVSKRELLDRVWRGTAVSEAALVSALRDLRRALGDSGEKQSFVRTVPKRGVKLVAHPLPVAEGREDGATATVRPSGKPPPASFAASD